MTQQSDTPETDAASKLPEQLKEYFVVPSHIARKLERERDEARRHKDDARFAHTVERSRWESELDQLRKVADELASCLSLRELDPSPKTSEILNNYNQLPHVKQKEQS